ncbi:MAG: hypothetical protein Q8Q89_00975 [bacterium]|nr:hypothetical protein [bacterium]
MFNKEKFSYIFLIISVVLMIWNTVISVWLIQISDLPQKIEDYLRGDTFIAEEIIDNLAYNIEESYKIKMPAVELHVNFAERSKTGIFYDNSILHLYISPRIFRYSEKNLRAYFAHEFGHYVLNHFQKQEASNYPFYGSDENRNIQAEIEADLFVLRFSESKDLIWVINDLVWGDEKRDDERSRRLYILANTISN